MVGFRVKRGDDGTHNDGGGAPRRWRHCRGFSRQNLHHLHHDSVVALERHSPLEEVAPNSLEVLPVEAVVHQSLND